MKRFLEDKEIITISTKETMEEVLDYISKDVWVNPLIRECAMVPVPEGSRMFGTFESTFEVEQSPLKTIEVSPDNVRADEEDIDSAETNKEMLMVLPMEDRYVVYPTRYTSFLSICQRAGLGGSTIYNEEKKPLIDPLPIREKAQWLSRGFSLHKANCNILIRDGKISSMMSAEYAIMPLDKIIPEFESRMRKEHTEFELKGGSMSHEYFLADYYLNDPVMEESFSILLENVGYPVSGSVRAGVRVTSSDVGNCMVTAAPFYIVNGSTIRLGEPLGVRHDSGNTPETFLDKIPELGMLFKESEERVEELGNTRIENPVWCFRNILEAHKSLKSGTEELIKELQLEFPNGSECTAIDIYFYLNRIVEERDKKKPLSPTQKINLSEEIAKFLFCDFTQFDHIGEL